MSNPSKSSDLPPSSDGPIADEWATLVESGAGLSDGELGVDDRMSAPIEKLQPQPFSLSAEVKKHPVLYLGLGALAVAGVAAFLGRGAISRTARPIIVRSVRPMLVRAAARRPVEAARLAARHPRTAARLFAGLR
ncbi:MAG TPA: hypothetical protein VFW47_07445 [Phenylobacterium sp.]|nr:hypothetical protein [Phenylobacterium sp.]